MYACTDRPLTPPPSQAELLEQAVQAKLHILRHRKMQQCKDQVMTDAISMVDSIIALEFKMDFVDTIRFPNKPLRPGLPGGKIILDTTPVMRIIVDTITAPKIAIDTSLATETSNDTLQPTDRIK